MHACAAFARDALWSLATLSWLTSVCGTTHACPRLSSWDHTVSFLFYVGINFLDPLEFPPLTMFFWLSRGIVANPMEWFENVSGEFLKVWCPSNVWQNSYMMSSGPRIFLHEFKDLFPHCRSVQMLCFQKRWDFLFFYLFFCLSDLCCLTQKPVFSSFSTQIKLLGMILMFLFWSQP